MMVGRRKKKKRRRREKEEFFFVEEPLRCSILTVPATSTSCRPSKKCLSFSFSLRYVAIERRRRKKEELS